MYIAPIYVVSWTMTNEDMARNKHSEIVKAAVEMSCFHFVKFCLCEKAWVALVLFLDKSGTCDLFFQLRKSRKTRFFSKYLCELIWWTGRRRIGITLYYSIEFFVFVFVLCWKKNAYTCDATTTGLPRCNAERYNNHLNLGWHVLGNALKVIVFLSSSSVFAVYVSIASLWFLCLHCVWMGNSLSYSIQYSHKEWHKKKSHRNEPEHW